MGLFLIDGQKEGDSFPNSTRQTHEKTLSQFLQQDPSSNASVSPDEVLYMAVLSIFLLPLPQWRAVLPRFLRWGLQQALACSLEAKKETKGEPKEEKAESTSSPTLPSEEKGKEKETDQTAMDTTKQGETEEEAKPMETDEADDTSQFGRCRAFLIYLALINGLHDLYKKKGAAPATSTNLVPTCSPTDEWLQTMRQLIRSSDEAFHKASHNLLETYQDLFLNYASFDEFFDDLGVLDVLTAESVNSCDEYVQKLEAELKKSEPQKS